MVITEVTNTSNSSARGDIPKEVRPAENSDLPRGVEKQALVLARAFMAAQGQLARKCYRRGELSHLYVTTFESWAPEDAKSDQSLQRPFKQILFAIAHGMKLVRVINSGRQLLWNHYRDNTGAQIETSRDQQDRRPSDYRDDSRPGPNSHPPHHRYDRRRHHSRHPRNSRHRYDRRDGDWQVTESRRSRHRDDRRPRHRDRYSSSPPRPRGSDCETAFLEHNRDGELVMARDQERAMFEAAKHRWENECRRRSRSPSTDRNESHNRDE